MGITVEVRSHAILGGGAFAFCVYKIEVQSGKDSWAVYRRYSEFVRLYDHARHEVGNNFRNLNVPLVEPGNGGTLYGTFQETIYARVPILNAFIQKLVGLDPTRLLNCVANFIDVTNKGASGISIQKGKSNVLIETFLKCKHHFFSTWQTRLIVLTKDGYLYELNTMFDTSEKAVTAIALSREGVQINGRRDKLIADVTYNMHEEGGGKKLHIRFPNASDLANFLRASCEFLSRPSKNLDRGYRPSTKKQEEAPAPSSDVYSKGTGNTTDVLSSTYGL